MVFPRATPGPMPLRPQRFELCRVLPETRSQRRQAPALDRVPSFLHVSERPGGRANRRRDREVRVVGQHLEKQAANKRVRREWQDDNESERLRFRTNARPHEHLDDVAIEERAVSEIDDNGLAGGERLVELPPHVRVCRQIEISDERHDRRCVRRAWRRVGLAHEGRVFPDRTPVSGKTMRTSVPSARALVMCKRSATFSMIFSP